MSTILRLVGGARWANRRGGIGQAGWPLIRLTVTNEAIAIEPTITLAKWLVPSRMVPWTSVERLEGAGWGVRIVIRGEPSLVFMTWPHRKNAARALQCAQDLGVTVIH